MIMIEIIIPCKKLIEYIYGNKIPIILYIDANMTDATEFSHYERIIKHDGTPECKPIKKLKNILNKI